MKQQLAIVLLLFFSALSAQKNFNSGFEQTDSGTGRPAGWSMGVGRNTTSKYSLTTDSSTAVKGTFSARLTKADAAEEFGAFSIHFPADFAGSSITLTGWIKTEKIPDGSWTGLWMRVDGDAGALAFDNMQGQNVTGTRDWKQYTIVLDYPKDGQTVYVGGLLVGEGAAWFDELEVTVDGKPLLDAPARVIPKKPAELDTAFNTGSKVVLGTLDAQRVEDLVLLGKVWGFLKYHHPKIARGDLNWDFELFRFLERYPAGMKPKQRDQLLVDWIKSLGPLPDCAACSERVKGAVHLQADLDWIKDKQLSAPLRKSLKEVYDHRNQSDHYYIDLVPYVGNPKFKHENPYSQLKYPDEGFRLLCLYRFWNIIQYYFPYRDVIGEDWTGVLREFVPKMAQAPDALSYKLRTRELIGRIHDTHANLWIQDEGLRRYFGELRPAVQIKFIENQAVVTGYYHNELGPKTGLLPGDVITSVEGVAVEKIVGDKLPLYPASNYPTQLRDIAKDLLRTNASPLHLAVQRDGRQMDVAVECFDATTSKFELSKDWAYNKPDSCYRLLTPDIGYIYLGNVKNDLLPGIMEKFKNTKGLIVDIRNYPSEFVVFTLGSLLKSEPSNFVYFTNGQIKNPGVFTKTDMLENGEENDAPYQGKVVILVNEISQSQAEYTTMALRSVPGAVVVGSTTAGADGNVSDFALPGGLRSMISGIGVFYPDGTATQRVGIVPDHKVVPTIAGVKAGIDELLEYAMKIIVGP